MLVNTSILRGHAVGMTEQSCNIPDDKGHVIHLQRKSFASNEDE
jgi:hypothetical protein